MIMPNELFRRSEYKQWLLVVLVIVYAINTMDRQVLALLLEDIKNEFLLSDTQLGLLGGIAFAMFYSTMGIPLAAWLDRGDKGKILSGCVLLWSLATISCGMAVGFATLLVARMMTAVGEAGGSPASHALISEHFGQNQRVTALSTYALGVPLGALIGNFISGWINEYYDWRIAFLAAGAPGVVMAVVVFFIVREREPVQRREGSQTRNAKGVSADQSIIRTLRFMWGQKAFVHMCLAAALHSIVYYAGATWNASFFIRSHGLSAGEAGTMIASFSLGTLGGTFVGGYLSDRLAKRYAEPRWVMWIPGYAILMMFPFQFISYLSTDMTTTVVSFVFMLVLAATFFGPSYAVCQMLAKSQMRASAAAMYLFIQTLVGLGLGPLIVGLISDQLTDKYGSKSLSYALAIVGVANLWSAYHYFRGSRTYRADAARACA